MAPARAIDAYLEQAFPIVKEQVQQRDRLRRIAVARLALEHFWISEPLPQDIRSLLPAFLDRLGTYLVDGGKPYLDDFFAKDVRYALGITLPAGALQFDVGRIGPKLVAREMLRSRSFRVGISYLKALGWRRWYYEHMDLRAARHFNAEGWTDHCLRMVEILRLNVDMAGIVGAGWFYDPALAEVSPGLSYIQKTQTRYGAFLLKLPTEPHHIENALYRSASRRRLYEEGRYKPACYMCVWPRKGVLRWVERLKHDAGAAFGASGIPDAASDLPGTGSVFPGGALAPSANGTA